MLLVHGPPFGACDLTEPRYGSVHAGSKTLRETIVRKKPRVTVTGHIHEGYGEDSLGETRVLNVAHMTAGYEPLNPPVTFELASLRERVPEAAKPLRNAKEDGKSPAKGGVGVLGD